MTKLIAIACALYPTIVSAQTAPPAPQEPSAFCQSGSVAADFGGGNETLFASLWQKCRKGDIIQIPGASLFVISRICDFSRPLISSGGKVVCSLIGKERPLR